MRSSLTNVWLGGEEEQLNRIFQDFLRTPGNHPYLTAWLQVANGEPLALLYDVWTEANKLPDQAYKYVQLFMEKYNVAPGTDMVGEAAGAELFFHDLTELCKAVDSWLMAGQLSAQETGIAQASAEYYRSVNGLNPGAINIIRGWYELLQVVRDTKRVIRCTATDCNKLLVISPDNDIYSGTVDGYHSTDCKVLHTAGSTDQKLTMQQLPGQGQLQETVGPITQENPNEQGPAKAS